MNDNLKHIGKLSGVSHWFVARSLPHKELTARTRLCAQGYTVFLPMRERTIRHARRMLNVRRPVFPRYLFVRFDPTRTQWRAINGTIGVDRLIMRGEVPEPVAPGVVESLIASIDNQGSLQFREPIKSGDPVRLLDGPFAEQLGVLQSLGPNDRVRVLLSFLGGSIPVRTDRSSLILAV